jgi:hypothetical protein
LGRFARRRAGVLASSEFVAGESELERSSRTGLRTALTAVLAFVGTMLGFAVGAATNIATGLIPRGWDWAHDSAHMWTVTGILAVVAALLTALHVYVSLKQPTDAGAKAGHQVGTANRSTDIASNNTRTAATGSSDSGVGAVDTPRGPGRSVEVAKKPSEMTREERWDFFIAYASPDQMAAETLFELLSSPFRVFLDRRNLLPGDDWSSRLSAAQSLATVTLVLISSHTDIAYYQREEIARAIELTRREDDLHRVVPILLDEPANTVQLPYGLRLKQAISVTEAGGLVGVANQLKGALQHRMAMPASEIQQRYTSRNVLERAVRLVPRQSFNSNDGLLGAPSRAYVFVGDYDEQRHRTLRQILSNLWIGDAFERVDNSNVAWLALIFEVGELNRRKLDLLPATWKAAFRILSDPKRAARFEATDEETARLGRPPRDYYSDDQNSWYSSCTTDERRWSAHGELVEEVLGISWTCFTGTGITEQPSVQSAGIPSRVFFVKNLSMSSITYQVQDLGVPDDGTVLA